jgi:pterin-4a-carbinolamine dehydratase
MKFLSKGLEPEQRVKLLFQLTKIGSENIKSALVDHLTKGLTENDAAMLNDVSQQNFNRALKRLNCVAGIVEQIKELDWE